MAYFRMADTPRVFRDLDSWLYRRMRQVHWKEGKVTTARYRNLRALGVAPVLAGSLAASSKGCWRVAISPTLSIALPKVYWDNLGLRNLSQTWRRLRPA